jgi:glutaminyl-peptide cyclotransferase
VGLLALLLPTGPAGAQGEVPVFSGQVAHDWIVEQCELGPRTPGSEGNRQLRAIILEHAATHGLPAAELCFSATDPLSDRELELCNVVVSAGPATGPRLWLGAHFDTRPISDKDPDPARRGEPLVGANDGASGVAVLLHLMEILGARQPLVGVDLLFLDGEDSGSAGRPQEFCLGSAHLARTWQDFGHPLSRSGGAPVGVIILDMVGDSDLTIPMEQYSLRYSPQLLERVFQRAAALGLPAFEARPGPAVYDDHIPFIQAGIPAIDLIDFDYPPWHTTADVPSACSPASLEQVGTLMVDLLYNVDGEFSPIRD